MSARWPRPACAAALLVSVVLHPHAATADLSFVTRADFPAGSLPTAAAAGSVNDDRLLDLIVADSSGLSVLFGAAHGTFATPLTSRTAAQPSAVATADFDGDGHLDVAYVSNL